MNQFLNGRKYGSTVKLTEVVWVGWGTGEDVAASEFSSFSTLVAGLGTLFTLKATILIIKHEKQKMKTRFP